MFLKCSKRRKNGKVHRSWSVVESRRFPGGKVAQQHVLYLGELNDSQQRAWERSLPVFDEQTGEHRQLALFPADRTLPATDTASVQVRLDELRLENARQWGACWLGDQLRRTLQFDDFFGARLPVSREDTDWGKVLRILVIYRLLAPGSEWRLHRHWFGTTALADLLGVDARAAQDDTLYRCHDHVLPLKEELFGHLRQRWSDLFGAKFDVLLYDLTSTYFECDVPEDENDPRRFGYSRDKRGDCVQVVVALVVTPEGLPLAYDLTAFIGGVLKLKVNRAKSAVARPWERQLLGFNFTSKDRGAKRRIAPKALAKAKDRIRELTQKSHRRFQAGMTGLRRFLLGWLGYFQFCETPSVLRNLESWTRRRLRCLSGQHWKCGPRAWWVAGSRPSTPAGPWRMSRTPWLDQTFPKAWFFAHGLPPFHVSHGPNCTEPPDADAHVRWCHRDSREGLPLRICPGIGEMR